MCLSKATPTRITKAKACALKNIVMKFTKYQWMWWSTILWVSLANTSFAQKQHLGKRQHSKIAKKNDQNIQWINFVQLEQVMQKSPRYIFIEVETSWCVYCKMLNKTTFTKQPVIETLNKNFYAVKLNAEQPQKIRFAGNEYPFVTQSNGQGIQGLVLALKAQSYPSLLVLSPDYKVIHRYNGYVKAKKLAPLLTYLGEEKYKQQTWESFIKKYQKEQKKRRRKEKK